jgi:hypothetical protein
MMLRNTNFELKTPSDSRLCQAATFPKEGFWKIPSNLIAKL